MGFHQSRRIIHPRYPDDWAKDGLCWEGLQWNLDLGGWQDHRPATWFNTSKRGGRWCVSFFLKKCCRYGGRWKGPDFTVLNDFKLVFLLRRSLKWSLFQQSLFSWKQWNMLILWMKLIFSPEKIGPVSVVIFWGRAGFNFWGVTLQT